MPKLSRLVSIAALLAALPAAAQAQQPAPAAQAAQPAPDSPEIVVTGERLTPDQVKSFVDALTKAPIDGQLSRFERSVCPAAVGLPSPFKEAVLSRIRQVAVAVGLPVGGPKCAVNLLLIVTRDKPGLLRQLAHDEPRAFGDMRGGDFRKMAADPAPAAVWYLKGSVNADGQEMPTDELGQASVNKTTRAASRLNLPARPAVTGAAIVIDAKALPGLSTTQLADYAAMRTLARTDPANLPPSGPPTILKVLDASPESEVPVTLTPTDLAFLRGLYRTGTVSANAQRSQIRREIEKTTAGEKR